jgi:hypothetical protein
LAVAALEETRGEIGGGGGRGGHAFALPKRGRFVRFGEWEKTALSMKRV